MGVIIKYKLQMSLMLYFLLAFTVCVSNTSNQSADTCSNRSEITAKVLDSLEFIFFPKIPSFTEKTINHFNLWANFEDTDIKRYLDSISQSDIKDAIEDDKSFSKDEIECIHRLSMKSFEDYASDNLKDNSILFSRPIILENKAYLRVTFYRDRTFASGFLVNLELINESWVIRSKQQVSIG